MEKHNVSEDSVRPNNNTEIVRINPPLNYALKSEISKLLASHAREMNMLRTYFQREMKLRENILSIKLRTANIELMKLRKIVQDREAHVKIARARETHARK